MALIRGHAVADSNGLPLRLALRRSSFVAPSRAAVGGMSYQGLLRDPDFTRAVKTIAEQCSINFDIAKLKCQGG